MFRRMPWKQKWVACTTSIENDDRFKLHLVCDIADY